MAGAASENRLHSLLERDEELRRIVDALEAARSGAGSLLLVEGPGGIGKTELLEAARRRAAAAGMAIATARGSELERELPFGVVRQLVEPFVAIADGSSRAELFAGAAALAQPLFDLEETAGAAPGAEAGQTFAVLHGLFWLCANLAQARPLLLLVDDAHWADLASLRFLTYLSQRREGLPIALVVAARAAETPAEEEFLVRLAADPRGTTLAPAPLSPDAVADVLAAGFECEPAPEFVAACHAATGGTPFLVRELVRELEATRVTPLAASADRVHELGPRAVARTVIARARRLGPGALELAQAAAALGADAEPHVAARLAGLEEASVVELLDRLAGAGIVREGRPVEFVHPIVRAAVYGEMPAGQRSRLHVRAAELLSSHGIREERVAAHLLATLPSGDQRTVELLVRTAGAALARGAPTSAAAYLARAVAEPPDPSLRAPLLRRLAVAETMAGRADAAVANLEEARRAAADATLRAQVARDLVSPLMALGRRSDAVAALEGARAEGHELEPDLLLAIKAELLLIGTLEPTVYPDVEQRLGPLEVDLAGSSPGVREYLAALTSYTGLGLRPAAEVRRLASRAQEAGIVRELSSGVIGWANVVYPMIAAEGYALAQRMIDEAFAELTRATSVLGAARAHAARSFLQLRRGNVRAALGDARTAVDIGREGGFQGWPIALSTLVEALVERGDPDAADGALADADAAGDIPDTFMYSWVLFSRGRLRLLQGRVDDALADLEELGSRGRRRNHHNPGLLAHRSTLATALLGRDDARAAALAGEELALSERWGTPRAIGVSLRAVALVERGDAGLARLRESVEMLAASGARLEHARSLVELGAALRRRGARTEARDPLHAGMELAHECGAPPLVERAREELVATGARPRRIMRTGVDALTASELRIARQAADGMTNREIAQALFITQRTVETHLTQVFRKLDITSRTELADVLA